MTTGSGGYVPEPATGGQPPVVVIGDTCCEGVLSGYVDQAGVPARMCDDNCLCWSCVMCRTFE